jgi:hypothetical protein
MGFHVQNTSLSLQPLLANKYNITNEQFEVIGFIKPGAIYKWVLESATCNIDQLSTDDFL